MTTIKKSRWGIGIAVVYGTFMLIMIGMVVASRFQSSDLVARDYYEREINYQNQINRLKRTSELGHQIVVSFDRNTEQIVIAYPQTITRETLAGTFTLFRPANAASDRTYDISVDENHQQYVSCGQLPRGLWKVKFVWQAGTDSLYSEQVIDLE